MVIPTRLRNEPLVEAIWELRFASKQETLLAILPGILYSALGDKNTNIIKLPFSELPSQIAENDPNLKYTPKIRVEGDNQSIQIGDYVIALSCRKPYSGWKKFSSSIRKLIKIVKETGYIEGLERFSLRYIDIIALGQPPDIKCLNLNIKIGDYDIDAWPIKLRTEIREKELIHILQIASPAKVTLPGEPEGTIGVVIDIDTIRSLTEGESWKAVYDSLDKVHQSCKEVFFGLLTEDTLSKLEPEYK